MEYVYMDMGISRKQLYEDIPQFGEIDDDSYRSMIRGLIFQQRDFLTIYNIGKRLRLFQCMCF